MMAILNLKTTRDKCLSPVREPDMVLVENHTQKDVFDLEYKPSFRIFKKTLDKAYGVQYSTAKVR